MFSGGSSVAALEVENAVLRHELAVLRPIRRARIRPCGPHPARRGPASRRRQRRSWWSSVSWSQVPSRWFGRRSVRPDRRTRSAGVDGQGRETHRLGKRPAGEHRQIAQSWPVPSSSDAQAGSALVYRHQRYRLQPAPTNERLSHEMDWFTGSSQVHVTSRTARTLASRTRSSCAGRTARICSFTRTCTSWSNRAGSSCSSITCTRSAPNERRVGPGGGLHGSPPPTSNVEEVTMAAMAALGIRSGSLQFVRSGRSRCKRQVSANGSARARTPATPCHAEGRGFESHHPL